MTKQTDASAPTTTARSLSVGDAAPDFTLLSDRGEMVSLSELRGHRVLVYFFPSALTPGCTQQACDFSDSLDSLSAAGFEVLGISPDPPERLAEFRRRDHLTITLLSNPDMTTVHAYGAFGEKSTLGGPVMGLIRSTFVVDARGRLELARYDVAPSGHVAALRHELGLTGN